MRPTLSPGDLVLYRPINFKSADFCLKQGCLVIVKHPLRTKTLLIKRVHQKNRFGIEIRGDNERESTDSRQFGYVKEQHIHGVVEKIIKIKVEK